MLKAALVLALALAGVVVALTVFNAALRGDLGDARRDLATKDAQIESARLSASVHKAHLERQEQANADLDAVLRDLRQREGYNAPLSDFGRAVLEQLQP